MKQENSKYEKLGESLQGVFTIETLAERLKIDRLKAIYIIYRLRKLGFVKTSYGSEKRRSYFISLKNKLGGESYTEKINKACSNPALKIASFEPHYIHGREITYEEALIYAIKKKEIRYTIASLSLFRKISNWNLLYGLAKKDDLIPEVVAIYEVARKVVRKIRKMPKRFLGLAKKSKRKSFSYLIKGYSSDDFRDIEKKWKIYIPLNHADLGEYAR